MEDMLCSVYFKDVDETSEFIEITHLVFWIHFESKAPNSVLTPAEFGNVIGNVLIKGKNCLLLK